MPDGGDALTVRMAERIAEIPAAAWNACADPANPFVSYAFLEVLEASRSVAAKAGWAPRHIVAEDAQGRVVGVVPLYLKSHSYGEYVFDHGWADAYERAGGRYYPKLQAAVPFTPVPGPRLLVRPGGDAAAIRQALIESLAEITERLGVSSLHVTFCTADEAAAFKAAGWLIRNGRQFHWNNNGYKSFDDFLAALSHSRRKSIRRERRQVAEQGIEIDALTGSAIEPRHWDAFFEFYIATSDRKWGSPYLNRDFFHRLGAAMADRVLLVLPRQGKSYIAGALNLIGADTLYGRNWGSHGEFPFLHFEACYYQAIDFAIRHGLQRVEAGAQGEHKIQRGYLPVPTFSAHWIPDSGFRKAVASFLVRETEMIEHEVAALAGHSPFKTTEGCG
ncbi:MAG TPA: GNAT family N-acetyltransferase [Alphaproteobacteria bacterium]